jgi:hypothetical protein
MVREIEGWQWAWEGIQGEAGGRRGAGGNHTHTRTHLPFRPTLLAFKHQQTHHLMLGNPGHFGIYTRAVCLLDAPSSLDTTCEMPLPLVLCKIDTCKIIAKLCIRSERLAVRLTHCPTTMP